MSDFDLALRDVCTAWPAMLPANRMRVSEGVAQNLIIKRPGGAGGPWDALETAYMVEPTDMLGSRTHSAVCFVGPAQTGKTVALVDGWLTHNVINDPGDMLIVQMTQDKAREYSQQRIDRAIKASPNLKAMATGVSRDDNLHDKAFKNGMRVKFAWPTASNMSSTSYRYTAGTDYDRWADDIDGEGDGFTLMGKRIATYLSRGMEMVESSPGRPITDPTWSPSTPHEAPPVKGILSIYNRGDRRRFYWKCPHCCDWFQASPGLSLFSLPDDEQLIEDVRDIDIDKFARQFARIACPVNGCVVLPAEREIMNRTGRWLQDGLLIDALDRISGEGRTSSIASYWLGGVSATYVTWFTLVQKHLQALLDYALTGSELGLLTTANTDQGIPYMSRHLVEAARGAGSTDKMEHDLERFVVPDEGRFVLAAVDVQGGKNARFVVQVHAIGEHNEQWTIDRYDITRSKRPGMGAPGTPDEFAPIDPAAYPEDWDVLTDHVVNSTYRTNDPTREIRVKAVIVDTGGEGRKKGIVPSAEENKNVTTNAYAWARRLRKAGLLPRVRLSKGVGTKADWHVRETKVGGKAGEGDVTLFLLEPNKFKDIVTAGMQRRTPGPGYYHFPEPKSDRNPTGWISPAFFEELKAEVRNEAGVYEQIKKRNEAFDLCYMIRALSMILGADKREFWASPPAWARTHDLNSEVFTPEARLEMKAAAAMPRGRERRVSRSSYLN